jgi:hypothetical protein
MNQNDANLMTPGKAFVPMGSRIVEPVVNAEEGNWITIEGTHVLVKGGESVDKAFKRTTGKSLKGGSSDKGSVKGSDKKSEVKSVPPTKEPTKSATPLVTNDHKEYDTKLIKALQKENNRETGKAIAAEQEKGLTDHIEYAKQFEDSDALSSYTGIGYTDLNAYLRGDLSEEKATEKLLPRGHITKLDKMISGAPDLPDGTVIYRGVGERGVGLMINMKPGDICTDKGFQSFSTNPEKATQFATSKQSEKGGRDKVLIRAVTAGSTKGLVIGGGEHEVLIGHGTGWKVVSNNMVKQDRLTRMHVITVVPA